MKNALYIGGAIAAILTLQVVSFRCGVADGQHRERYGKCLTDIIAEMAVLTTFVHKFSTAVKDAK